MDSCFQSIVPFERAHKNSAGKRSTTHRTIKQCRYCGSGLRRSSFIPENTEDCLQPNRSRTAVILLEPDRRADRSSPAIIPARSHPASIAAARASIAAARKNCRRPRDISPRTRSRGKQSRGHKTGKTLNVNSKAFASQHPMSNTETASEFRSGRSACASPARTVRRFLSPPDNWREKVNSTCELHLHHHRVNALAGRYLVVDAGAAD